ERRGLSYGARAAANSPQSLKNRRKRASSPGLSQYSFPFSSFLGANCLAMACAHASSSVSRSLPSVSSGKPSATSARTSASAASSLTSALSPWATCSGRPDHHTVVVALSGSKHRREVARGIVWELFERNEIDGHSRRVGEQERVAVGCSARDGLVGQDA